MTALRRTTRARPTAAAAPAPQHDRPRPPKRRPENPPADQPAGAARAAPARAHAHNSPLCSKQPASSSSGQPSPPSTATRTAASTAAPAAERAGRLFARTRFALDKPECFSFHRENQHLFGKQRRTSPWVGGTLLCGSSSIRASDNFTENLVVGTSAGRSTRLAMGNWARRPPKLKQDKRP